MLSLWAFSRWAHSVQGGANGEEEGKRRRAKGRLRQLLVHILFGGFSFLLLLSLGNVLSFDIPPPILYISFDLIPSQSPF